jgi:hypothetical protein
LKSVICAAALCAIGGAAAAQGIPYPNGGTQNTASYSFTAAATGEVDAYFAAETSASYAEAVELIVNGVATGNFGLINHSTTAGTEFDMGNVLAGDTISFAIQVYTTGTYGEGQSYMVYSDPSLNLVANGGIDSSGNGQHIYSTNYTQGSGLPENIPSGVYVGFEDAVVPGADLNYADETYVFTDVGVSTTVPEPAALALFGAGLVSLAALRRRRAV